MVDKIKRNSYDKCTKCITHNNTLGTLKQMKEGEADNDYY